MEMQNDPSVEVNKSEPVVVPKNNNNLAIPAAIVIAGALIAAGIFFGGGNSTPKVAKKEMPKSIELKALDSTDHLLGNPNADLVVIEYSDLECPYCQRMHKTFETLMGTMGKDGKLAWAYRHFPLRQIHPSAQKAAEASECVAEIGGNDKFWAFINYVFENEANQAERVSKITDSAVAVGVDKAKFETCLNSGKSVALVEQRYQEALKAGGRGTPFNIFVPKNPIKKESVKTLIEMFASYPANQNPLVYADQKVVALSAYLEVNDMQQIIDIILK